MCCAVAGHGSYLRAGCGMNVEQRALNFDCHGDSLCGILSWPEQPRARGVLIVVGGPQYRVGSHRQFALLASSLAADGIPVMRFDYRGMGDSAGDARSFEAVDDDVRAAIDHFFCSAPGLQEVVLWGLCDAAAAAVFYAHQDARVTGLVLLNPWVRTEAGIAQATLKHYYLERLAQPGFWKKIVSGRFDSVAAGKSFLRLVGDAFIRGRKSCLPSHAISAAGSVSLPQRMLDGLQRFQGKVLFILSGDDLTAKEFSDLVAGSGKWKKILASSSVTRLALAGANHTFSQRKWRDQVACWTRDWMLRW